MFKAFTTHSRLWLASLVFGMALGLRLFDLNAAGNVWDEHFYYDAIRDYTRNVTQLDFRAASWKANREHPPLGKYTYAPAIAWNHLAHPNDSDAYTAPRAVSALVGAFTVALMFWLGARLYSTRVGLFAAAIYGLLPAIVAYHRIIDLDVTLMLWWTVAMGAFLVWQETRKPATLWWAVLAAVLAMTTKFNAVLIAIPFYGALLIEQWRAIRKTGNVSLPLPLLLFPALFGLTLFAIWPWLWSDPVGQFNETIGHWGGIIRELYFGQIRTGGLEYFAVHFVVGTPLVVLFLLLVGLYQPRAKRTLQYWTLALFLVAPFAISFFHLRQDHLRYVLTAYSAGALIAAIGLERLSVWVKHRWNVPIWLPASIVGGSLLWSLAAVHPYSLNYYNPLVGGTSGVAERKIFEIGFYGEGIREATEFVNRTAPAGATVHYEVIPDDVPYLDRLRLRRLDVPPGADYLITNTNAFNSPEKRDNFSLDGYEVVYEVKAADTPFVWVYQRVR